MRRPGYALEKATGANNLQNTKINKINKNNKRLKLCELCVSQSLEIMGTLTIAKKKNNNDNKTLTKHSVMARLVRV